MEAEKQRKAEGRGLYEWVQSLVCVVVPLLLVFTFAARIVRVDGGSMRETLQNGDLLLVLDPLLCGEYDAGDIVIVQKPGFNNGVPIVSV